MFGDKTSSLFPLLWLSSRQKCQHLCFGFFLANSMGGNTARWERTSHLAEIPVGISDDSVDLDRKKNGKPKGSTKKIEEVI